MAQKQPIFAFVNVMGTHMPFHPNREYIERCAGLSATRRRSAICSASTATCSAGSRPWATTWTNRRAIISGMYNAEVATQDDQLGVFFERLRTSGAGPHPCDHRGGSRATTRRKDFVGHSISLYNELTPRPPDHSRPQRRPRRGATVDHPVSTRRLFHTALAAAGGFDAGEERYSLAKARTDRVVFAEAITDENVLKIIRRQAAACGRISLRPAPSRRGRRRIADPHRRRLSRAFNFSSKTPGETQTSPRHACQGR